MLVLTRRQNEKIVFPGLGIKIQLSHTSTSKARIGIEAPPQIQVLRSELLPDPTDVHDRTAADQRFGRAGTHQAEAAELLRRLQETVNATDWEQSQGLVASLIDQLRGVDQQVAEYACRAVAKVQQHRRALLVEDNENESRLLAGYMRLKDFSVDTASDGADAVKYLESNHSPDVVVLDMNMPVYDGRWTVNNVRSNPKYQGLKIYAVSGSRPEDHGVELGQRGVDRWFQKPLNPETLVNEIKRGIEEDLTTVA